MRSFRFRLQALLDLRRRQTETEEAKLAQMVALRNAMEQRRQDLRRSDADARAALALSESHHAADLQTVGRFSSHVIAACASLARQIADQNRKIESQRQVIREHKRNEQLLEELRDEEMEEWKRAVELELEGLGSDSYIAAWNRRQLARRRDRDGEQ